MALDPWIKSRVVEIYDDEVRVTSVYDLTHPACPISTMKLYDVDLTDAPRATEMTERLMMVRPAAKRAVVVENFVTCDA